jgi:hypothetical protein
MRIDSSGNVGIGTSQLLQFYYLLDMMMMVLQGVLGQKDLISQTLATVVFMVQILALGVD